MYLLGIININHFIERVIFECLSRIGSMKQSALAKYALDFVDPNIRFGVYQLRVIYGQEADVPGLIKKIQDALINDLSFLEIEINVNGLYSY